MSREYVFEFRLPQNPFQVIEQLEEIAVYLETKRDNAFKSVPKPCEVVVPGYARGVFVSPEGLRSFANRLSIVNKKSARCGPNCVNP